MKKVSIDSSCGNVFADIGIANADDMLIKARIVIKIEHEMRRRNLTQSETAYIIGVPQSRLSKVLRGQFANISASKLLQCLNKLGFDVQIKVAKRCKSSQGHTSISI